MKNTILISGLEKVALGAYFIYLSKSKKEKLGTKAKFVTFLGIAFIILAVFNVITGQD